MAAALCQVSGRVTDINGSPVIGAIVGFMLDAPGNEPTFLDGDALSTGEKVITTDPDGTWAINLLQGAKVVIRIEEINLHRQVTIPAQASATLEEVLNADV